MSSQRLRSSIGTAVALLISLGSVLAYVAISGSINAQPATTSFGGWITLLQRSSDPPPDGIELSTFAVQPGGDHPQLQYQVSVCGSRPFDGVLLIGGDARLDGAQLFGMQGKSRVEVEDLRNVVMGQGPKLWNLGDLQLVHISINTEGMPCSTSATGHLLGGVANVIRGFAQRPVKHGARYLWIDSAREAFAWPLVGTWPGALPTNTGEFEGRQGLSGTWVIPPTRQTQVDMGHVTVRGTIEAADPPVVDTSAMAWNSAFPIQPTLRITNLERSAGLQQDLALAAIGFGIAGSILASLLLRWVLGPESASGRAAPTTSAVAAADHHAPGVSMEAPTPAQVVSNRDVGRLVGLALVAYALGRLRR